MSAYTKEKIRAALADELSAYPGAAEAAFARVMMVIAEPDVIDAERGRSMKPRHVWKRRKAAAKRKADKDCPHCGGRGIIVYTAGGDTRRDECGCTESPSRAPSAPAGRGEGE